MNGRVVGLVGLYAAISAFFYTLGSFEGLARALSPLAIVYWLFGPPAILVHGGEGLCFYAGASVVTLPLLVAFARAENSDVRSKVGMILALAWLFFGFLPYAWLV